MHKKIVVVGSINLDLVAYVPRMPVVGETISGQNFAMYSGGKGANQAVSVARLGAEVVMIGRLGNDLFADRLRVELEATGVEMQCVRNVPGSSGSAVIMVTPQGDNAIIVIPGANDKLYPDDIDAHANDIRQASILLAQLEIPMQTVEYLGTVAHSLGIPILLDPAPARPLSPSLLKAVTWLTPNESETAILLGHLGVNIESFGDSGFPERAARSLLDLGVRNVLLKLGSKGVYMEGADVSATHIPAFHVEAVDTTAAGDAFNGAFAYALTVRAMAPVAAARFASAVAAISVTRVGAQPSMPKLLEVENFLESYATAK